ncbi:MULTISPECIES: hypothetical protein [Paenibacillus]|uniref:PepSY domain-containing protein n=1 Tax=Paenibacillus cineris TaxID=237530 RepID=A0ABQ4LBN1_9BACL|nr:MULTISPECIES: hypothetical protein [Paenibacillus]GIO53811.1 hypothetical protein J21TS7_21290 [Paenibacillus cineris]
MIKYAMIMLLLTTALLSGCEHSEDTKPAIISEEQAVQIVQQYEERNNRFGELKIVAVEHTGHQYQVTWERKSNCESGTHILEDRDGQIVNSTVSIC